jgi:hypothetical protein
MKPLTLLQTCKKIITTNDPVELGWPEGTTPYQVFMSEFGNYSGFNQQTVTEYCQGLPSLFDFPFENHEILGTLAGYGIVCRRSKDLPLLLEDYWIDIGYAAYRVLKEAKKNETVL